MTETAIQERLLRVADVATMLSVSVRTVWTLSTAGTIPAPIRIGPRNVRWRLSDVLSFIEAGGSDARRVA